MVQQMHAHIRQTEQHLDYRCARGNRLSGLALTRAALVPIELPFRPPPVDMAETHRNRYLPPCGLVEPHLVCPNQRLAVAPFLELKKSKRSFRTREALYFQ